MENQAVVIDNGTGFTKMGYAGNLDPDFVIPTAIADLFKKSEMSVSTKNDEYNFYIGEQAINQAKTSKNHKLIYPMQDGIIESWDLMEKYWHQSIYDYLKCDPQEHNFVLTEPPMNPPENRENIAEEMDKDQKKAIDTLTGVVVDSGDGVTHIVPICDGFVLGSNIKHIPIAGRKITKFMEQMIRDRGEKINTEDLYYATMELKEKHGYLAKDLVEEFAKFDTKKNEGGKLIQSSKFKKFSGIGKISSKPYTINVGYELFLGPESFFSPEIIDKNWKASLDESIDITIQQCPIDYRRRLYADVVFSGGSTSFKYLDRRLESSLQHRVDERLKKYSKDGKQSTIVVKVTNSMAQKHVVWLGGSSFSSSNAFKSMVHTRAEYMEKGPACCRFNPVFSF